MAFEFCELYPPSIMKEKKDHGIDDEHDLLWLMLYTSSVVGHGLPIPSIICEEGLKVTWE